MPPPSRSTPSLRSRAIPHRGPRSRRVGVFAAVLAATGAAQAADLPPAVVATFAQRVQPLLLNRCAAGACHGGAESPAPRIERGVGSARPDALQTRANMVAFVEAVGPDRDGRRLAALLAAGHPGSVARPALRVGALTKPERATLDGWLDSVRAAERAAPHVDPAVVPAAAEVPEPPARPNRLRALLEAAANPPDLPPPQEPHGVIFRNDVPPEE